MIYTPIRSYLKKDLREFAVWNYRVYLFVFFPIEMETKKLDKAKGMII